MSAFWIFAICLTVAYLIYYTVVICVDLYGRPKDLAHDDVETFDVTGMIAEPTKAVEVTDEGFRVGSGSGGDGEPAQWAETVIRPADADSKPAGDTPAMLDASGAPVSPVQEKIDRTQSGMEEIYPEMSGELMQQMMMSALTTGKPPVPIRRETASVETTGGMTDGEKAQRMPDRL